MNKNLTGKAGDSVMEVLTLLLVVFTALCIAFHNCIKLSCIIFAS